MNARNSSDTGDVARWDLPSVSGRSIQARRPGPTVGQLEDIEKKAYEEAYAAGREAGLAAARAEMQPGQERLRSQLNGITAVLDKLSKPLEDLDAEVGEQLARLAVSVAKQVIRRELRMDPSQVIAIMRETVALLPVSARQVRIHLHPEDAVVIRERLAAPGGDRAWSLVEDPVLTRGGCLVTTDTAQVDARLESRIASVVGAMFGDERLREEAEPQ
ncbi:MAG: flagellar assembly protein FliH [Povalibacter sp.]